jgi:hypothetical protein
MTKASQDRSSHPHHDRHRPGDQFRDQLRRVAFRARHVAGIRNGRGGLDPNLGLVLPPPRSGDRTISPRVITVTDTNE